VNARTREAEVTLAPPTSASGNDGNTSIYWQNMVLNAFPLFFFVKFKIVNWQEDEIFFSFTLMTPHGINEV
jgi:hypothetical protein